MSKANKLYIISIISFGVANLLSIFALLFVGYRSDSVSEAVIYIRIFLAKLIDFAIPVFAALALFIGKITDTRILLGKGFLLSLPRIAYTVPYYYHVFLQSKYDSRESIFMSLGVSAFGIAILFAQIMLIYFVMKKMWANDSKCAIGGLFDFSSRLTLGIFSGAFVQFIIALVGEIISTVEFVLSSGGFYRISEIIYMCICYLFVLFEMIITHCACHAIYKKSAVENKDEENIQPLG